MSLVHALLGDGPLGLRDRLHEACEPSVEILQSRNGLGRSSGFKGLGGERFRAQQLLPTFECRRAERFRGAALLRLEGLVRREAAQEKARKGGRGDVLRRLRAPLLRDDQKPGFLEELERECGLNGGFAVLEHVEDSREVREGLHAHVGGEGAEGFGAQLREHDRERTVRDALLEAARLVEHFEEAVVVVGVDLQEARLRSFLHLLHERRRAGDEARVPGCVAEGEVLNEVSVLKDRGGPVSDRLRTGFGKVARLVRAALKVSVENRGSGRSLAAVERCDEVVEPPECEVVVAGGNGEPAREHFDRQGGKPFEVGEAERLADLLQLPETSLSAFSAVDFREAQRCADEHAEVRVRDEFGAVFHFGKDPCGCFGGRPVEGGEGSGEDVAERVGDGVGLDGRGLCLAAVGFLGHDSS